MKEINFFILFTLLHFTFINAQNKNPFDPTNARIGEEVEYCYIF